MKKIVAILLTLTFLLTLTLVLLAGYGNNNNNSGAPANSGSAATEDNYVMQIMSSPALCSAPIFVGIEMGYLDEFGVKYEYFNSDSNQWDLMAAGKCDMAYGLMPTFIQRIANGFEMYVAMGAHFGCINVVASDVSGIQSISDLAGKTVGIPASMGSDPAILLQRMLVAYDIKISDVDLQVFTNADLGTALQEGFIEAFVSWDPYATVVSQQEGNRLIFNQADDEMTKNEYCCVFGLRPAFADEHPEIAKRFCDAMSKACQYIAENPEAAAKLCYDKGYIANADYTFNGQLLDSYRYETNFTDAKASFVRVTDDLIDLRIISGNTSGQQLADNIFINVGELN